MVTSIYLDFDDPELNYPNNHGIDDNNNGAEEHENVVSLNSQQDFNQLITSDEMYMSDSYGHNFSVTSDALDDQFDYVEDIKPVANK